MKKIFIAFLAAACMLGGCSKDENNDAGQSISISCGEVINANPAGEMTEVTIASTGEWRLAGVCDWVHPSAVKGQNGDKITLTIDANQSDGPREATLKFFTGSAIASVHILSQQGDMLQLITKPEMTCTSAAQDISIDVKTNLDELTYAFSDGGEKWVSFSSRTNAFGISTLTFKALINEAYDNRECEITISGEGVEPLLVSLTQKQTNAIKPEKTAYTMPLEAGKLVVKLQTNVEYKVEIPAKNQSWIHLDVVPQGRGLVEKSESFTIDAAEGLRSGKITFRSVDGTTSVTVTVVQQGDKHVYATVPDAKFRKYLFDNAFAVAVEGETEKIELTMDGINATEFTFPENSGIESIVGIKSFTKLTKLVCKYNDISVFDFGSLPVARLDTNSSNISGDMVVSGENITFIDAHYTYYLLTLDVSGCPKLRSLYFQTCYYVTTLYLKTGANPYISDQYTGYFAPGGTYEKVYK